MLGYNHPNTFSDPHLGLQVSAYTEKTQDINTFTETRYEGSLQLNDQVTPRTSLLYHYAFRKVLVSNLNTHISPAEIPLRQEVPGLIEVNLGLGCNSRLLHSEPCRFDFRRWRPRDLARRMVASVKGKSLP